MIPMSQADEPQELLKGAFEFHLKARGSIQEHSLTIFSMSTVLDIYNLISLASYVYSWALDDVNAKSLNSCLYI